jgi:hypothetical protein
LQTKSKESDSLFTYFSGHCHTVNNFIYWLPVDATAEKGVDFEANSDLKSAYEETHRFHNFLLANTNFSETLVHLSIRLWDNAKKCQHWRPLANHSDDEAHERYTKQDFFLAEGLFKTTDIEKIKIFSIPNLTDNPLGEVFVQSKRNRFQEFNLLKVNEAYHGQFVAKQKSSVLNISQDYQLTKYSKEVFTEQIPNNHISTSASHKENKTDLLAKLKSKVQECIALDNLQEALSLVEERIAENRPLINTFLLLKGRFSRWRSASLNGTLFEDSKSVTHAAIALSLLEFLCMLSESDIE